MGKDALHRYGHKRFRGFVFHVHLDRHIAKGISNVLTGDFVQGGLRNTNEARRPISIFFRGDIIRLIEIYCNSVSEHAHLEARLLTIWAQKPRHDERHKKDGRQTDKNGLCKLSNSFTVDQIEYGRSNNSSQRM